MEYLQSYLAPFSITKIARRDSKECESHPPQRQDIVTLIIFLRPRTKYIVYGVRGQR